MPLKKLSDFELNERLDELERDMGPTLHSIYAASSIRPAFAAGGPPTFSLHRPILTTVTQRAWAALAAVLVVGMAVGVALFAIRPQAANADEVLGQLQTEAEATTGFIGAPAPGCGAAPDKLQTGGVIAFQAGGPGSPNTASGPVTMANPNELSEKLAAALGLSGDQVRAAMLATIQVDMPATPPPDPMDAIAKQLGLPRDQVCSAFLQGPDPITGFHVGRDVATGGKLAPPPDGANANFIDLNTVTADQLKDRAQKLGVSPERLLAAVKAVAPPQAPSLKPLNPDEIIRRFAQNLGVSEDKVRAALSQVEGNRAFYFAVPLPGLSH